MYTDTEGIVLKQLKIPGGRRMVLLFSKKFGKISAGTNLSEKGKGKSALILRPFTYGRYELNKTRDAYYINGGEVLKSHYPIGENVDKYMQASYVMELTEKILPEEAAAPELFLLLSNFLDMMEKRSQKYDTLVLAYIVKALRFAGSSPELERCTICGARENLTGFSIEEGGVVCSDCRSFENSNQMLIFPTKFGIVDVLKYLLQNPLLSFEKLALDGNVSEVLNRLLKTWLAYHLDIKDLKSEEFT